MKLNKPNKQKEPFSSWVLNSETAFRILSLMTMYSGLVVSVLLLIISFVFEYHWLFKILFTIMTISQLAYSITAYKNRKNIKNTVNDFAYKGKIKLNRDDNDLFTPVKKEDEEK